MYHQLVLQWRNLPFWTKNCTNHPFVWNYDPMQFVNYRPVSLLPFFSKLFERLMYNRLIDFINKHKSLYDYQFGFTKNHSTFLELVTLLEQITTARDNAEFAICVLIDFRKAFDTFDQSIILQKNISLWNKRQFPWMVSKLLIQWISICQLW